MSTSASPPLRPRVVEGAVLASIAAAVFVAVTGAGLLVGIGDSRRQVEASGGPDVADAVVAALFGLGIAALLWAAVVAGLAVLFRTGRVWARPALIGVSVLVLLVLAAPTTGGITAVVLMGLADWMLLRRETGAWVARVRGRRADGLP